MSSIDTLPTVALRSPTAQRVVQASSVAIWRKFGYWAMLHAVLGVAGARFSMVSTIHAWGCLLAGVYFVGAGRSNYDLARYAAYVMGAEVFWRMTDAAALWEMGKYTVIAVLGLAILRSRPIRPTAVSVWYIGLLLPSSLVTMSELGFSLARRQVSFNISGPLAISVCAAFFSRCRFSTEQVAAIVRSALLPIVSMWTVVVLGIASAKVLTFGTESNHSMSGGFGPNQVSTMFGLAAMFCLMLALLFSPSNDRLGRIIPGAMALVFAMQAALTFSRSGLYLAVLASMTTIVFSLKNKRLRSACLVGGVAFYLIGVYVVFPKLDEFTGGALSERFSSTSGTGREQIIHADLDLWMAYPLFGVGPGMAAPYHAKYFHAAAAHCEISRVLAEHGLLGLIAMAILAVGLVKRLKSFTDPRFQGFMIACAAFGALVMFSNGMRIVAPSLLIGLPFCSEYVASRRPDYRQPAFR